MTQPILTEREHEATDRVFVAKLVDLPLNVPVVVYAGAVELVALRVADDIHLFEGLCPHRGALLGEGSLEGSALVCRSHGWRFDIVSGEKVADPRTCLQRFTPIVDEDGLYIEREELDAWQGKQVEAISGQNDGRTLRTAADLPGPPGVPLLGNLAKLRRGQNHLVQEEWNNEYGPIFRFSLAQREFVAFADSESVNHILRERPGAFRRVGFLEPISREIGIHGVFFAEGEEWRRYRRLAMEALSVRHLRQFFPTLDSVLQRLESHWAEAARTGSALDIQKLLMRFTVDVTTNLAFGIDLNTLEGDGAELQAHLSKLFPMLGRRLTIPVPYWRYVKLPIDRNFDGSMQKLNEIVDGFILEARRRMAANPDLVENPENFLQAMLAIQARDDESVTDEEIRGNVYNILGAGEDTTANTITWVLYYLCQYPEVQGRMQEEADAVLREDRRIVHFEDVERLVYTDAVIQESMRHKPVGPIMFHQTNEDVVVGDVALPAGSLVSLLTRPAALQEEHFVDAEKFWPDRWLAGCPHHGAHDRGASLPFGGGPRLCPGRSLALLEMKAVLAMVSRNFSVSAATDLDDVQEIFQFAMMPKGFRLHVESRS